MKITEAMKTEWMEYLKARLKPERLMHSIGVAETAVLLAKDYGADETKAYVAGLLHDAAKGLPKESYLAIAREAGRVPDAVETASPDILHGYVAAMMVRKDLGITDPEILEAIECHTVGKAGMSTLDKIIFVADYLEPGRVYPGVEALRSKAKEGLNFVVLAAIQQTVDYLFEKNAPIHPRVLEAYNEIVRR